jgi:hypothetical protein
MQKLIDLYLSWVNYFISLDSFSEYHGLDIEDAIDVIAMGEKYHNINVEIQKLKKENKL